MNKPAELFERANIVTTILKLLPEKRLGLEKKQPGYLIDVKAVIECIDNLKDHISSMGEPKVGLPEKLTDAQLCDGANIPYVAVTLNDKISEIIDYLTQNKE